MAAAPGALAGGLVRKSLSRQVYETLEQAIIDGRIAPGSRLGEDALAGAFSVSRSPAREAIVELERIGFAERVAVRDRRVTVPTAAFIVDVFEVWALLESERLHEASRNATDASLRELDRIVETLEGLHRARDREALDRLMPAFHAALQDGCRNRQLQRVAGDWHKYVCWVRNLYFDAAVRSSDPVEAAERAMEDHRQIVAAFRRRDREALLEVTRRHIEWQRDRIIAGWRASSAAELASSSRTVDFAIAGEGAIP